MTTEVPPGRRLPAGLIRMALALLLLTGMLFGIDALCYRVTLPVALTYHNNQATLQVGSQTLPLGQIGQPVAWQFAPRDPLVHEYQLDGSDSTNNFTLDTAYLHTIAPSPYYRFQSWMRDLDGTSQWRELTVWANHQLIRQQDIPAPGQIVPLPAVTDLRIALAWQRPETPALIDLITTTGAYAITLNRNDRFIQVVQFPGTGSPLVHAFFPTDPAPFAAMVVDSLIRVLLWALAALALVVAGEVGIALSRATFFRIGRWDGNTKITKGNETSEDYSEGRAITAGLPHRITTSLLAIATPFRKGGSVSSPSTTHDHTTIPDHIKPRSTRARGGVGVGPLHPIGLIALIASFAFVTWIALAQYQALPHIFDAAAYLFGGKILASGQLSVPIPPAVDRFPGPFMVQHAGRWFTQYAPGTSLTLAIGLIFRVPWLVEPVLGTLALLGIGLIANRLFDRRVATLAVILGASSPFYSYLAASYLSHAIALFYLVWGWYCLLRFAQDERVSGWLLPLAAALFGMAGLTRDLIAVLFVAIIIPGTLWLVWPRLRTTWRRWLVPGAAFGTVVLSFLLIYLGFNWLQTGDALVTPRSLFFAGDRWGFGPGIGFYGQHTLAAGFVTVDELLTSLLIDLYGWPFYLTLAFAALPFLTWRARRADWLMLAGAATMTSAFLGYYYHGIYLGPRYLFEALPFLLILTARGIVVLAEVALAVGHHVARWYVASGRSADAPFEIPATLPASVLTMLLVGALLASNLIFFLPRQIALHHNFTGASVGYQIDTAALLHPPAHHAIVVTGDYTLYGYTLFALNDPQLRGDVLYAFAYVPAQYQELRTAFPGRALYTIAVGPAGTITYSVIPPPNTP